MIDQASNVFMQLYQANVRLVQKLGESLQDAGAHLSRDGQEAIASNASKFSEEVNELLAIKDFPALIALQFNLVRRHWDRNQEIVQQALKFGAENPALAGRFQQAFDEWRQEVENATRQAGDMGPVLAPWSQYMAGFQQLWNPLAQFADAGGKPKKASK
jgi:hypothetical protein